MKVRDFRRLTGWVDYDRHLLGTQVLTKHQEIMYFKKRLRMILLLPLKEMYSSLMKKKKRSSIIACFGTCICCSIEALGKFHTGMLGKGNSGRNFKSYVKDYMNPDYSLKLDGKTYADILWESFRNGLAHGFTIKQGGFEHHHAYFQIKQIGGINQLEIDPTKFYNDFTHSIEKYIHKLKRVSANDRAYVHFKNAFVEVFVRGS